MIKLSRLGGSAFALNPDLIERVESTPDTVLVMVDATRYVVEQSLTEVIELIREDRARTLARVEEILAADERENTRPAALRVAYSAEERKD
jgi:flagellar flbD family protein